MVWIKLAGWDRKINIKKETLEESIKICALNCRLRIAAIARVIVAVTTCPRPLSMAPALMA